jgi:hypothetical protein
MARLVFSAANASPDSENGKRAASRHTNQAAMETKNPVK